MNVIKDNNSLLIELGDKFTSSEVMELEEKIGSLDGIEEITFDLKNLKSISSLGMRFILSCNQAMIISNGTMNVINANSSIIDLFEIAGFKELLNIDYNNKR